MKSRKLLLAATLLLQTTTANADWRTADRSSANLAPLPKDEPRAVVQVYAARVMRWRKYFAVHSWIATKEAGADHYLTYHVIGWRQRWGRDIVVIEKSTTPDGKWFGNDPELLYDLRGPAAARAIPSITSAASAYPYPKTYRAWPGPNSNTFISYIIRKTPELKLDLPPTAIGKDWIEDGKLAGLSESKTGVQLSLFGAFGLTLGLREGIEVNLLGLSFGVDLLRPALKLPLVGRVGYSGSPAVEPEEEIAIVEADPDLAEQLEKAQSL